MVAHTTRCWVQRANEGTTAPWIAGIKIKSKKMKKIRGRDESEDNVASVHQQRRQKACWYFVMS